MTIEKFIRDNRKEIDYCIQSVEPGCKFDNEERELWISNDEILYLWAQSLGVEV